MSSKNQYYEIEFNIALPRSVIIRAASASEARSTAMDVIATSVKDYMDFFKIRAESYKLPDISQLRITDIGRTFTNLREDSVGVFYAPEVMEGGESING